MDTIRRHFGAVAVLLTATAGLLGCAGSASPDAKSAPNTPISAEPAAEAPQTGSDDSAAPAPPPAAPGAALDRAEGSAQTAPRTSARPAEKKDEPNARPGLGTEWGETRFSRISTVPFVRADASSPFATASLFYNDAAGARAMASATGFRRTAGGLTPIASGAVTIGLRDESNNFLSGFVAADKNYVVGEAGNRYTIVIRNRTSTRFEVVVSVDGLDVLDGRAASFAKRGYLVDAGGELEIDGFRQSTDSVAAFRFGSVKSSYASQKHGETRNVGVIGVALFHERGSNPMGISSDEVRKRLDANPFPGQFATPPN
jgi:hypothetical protein